MFLSFVALLIATGGFAASLDSLEGDQHGINSTTNMRTNGTKTLRNQRKDCKAEWQQRLAQHGLSVDFNISQTTNETLIASLTAEPCFEYRPIYHQGARQIFPEILYQTLIYSLDWAYYKWSAGDQQHGKFNPKNVYGLSVKTYRTKPREWSDGAFTYEAIAYTMDTIAFFMQEDGRYEELEAEITNFGRPFSRVWVHLEDPSPDIASSSPVNDTFTGGDGVVNVTATDSSNGNVFSRRGDTPHTFQPSIHCTIQGSGAIPAQSEELLLSDLVALGRQALSLLREPEYVAGDKASGVVVVAQRPPGSYVLKGEHVLECLVDLMEWMFWQWGRTRSLRFVEVKITDGRQAVPRGTIEVRKWSGSWNNVTLSVGTA